MEVAAKAAAAWARVIQHKPLPDFTRALLRPDPQVLRAWDFAAGRAQWLSIVDSLLAPASRRRLPQEVQRATLLKASVLLAAHVACAVALAIMVAAALPPRRLRSKHAASLGWAAAAAVAAPAIVSSMLAFALRRRHPWNYVALLAHTSCLALSWGYLLPRFLMMRHLQIYVWVVTGVVIALLPAMLKCGSFITCPFGIGWLLQEAASAGAYLVWGNLVTRFDIAMDLPICIWVLPGVVLALIPAVLKEGPPAVLNPDTSLMLPVAASVGAHLTGCLFAAMTVVLPAVSTAVAAALRYSNGYVGLAAALVLAWAAGYCFAVARRASAKVAKPQERFCAVEQLPFGVGLRLRDGRLHVSAVDAGSAAASEGVKVGDILLEVAGRTASDLTQERQHDRGQGPTPSMLEVVVWSFQRPLPFGLRFERP